MRWRILTRRLQHHVTSATAQSCPNLGTAGAFAHILDRFEPVCCGDGRVGTQPSNVRHCPDTAATSSLRHVGSIPKAFVLTGRAVEAIFAIGMPEFR